MDLAKLKREARAYYNIPPRGYMNSTNVALTEEYIKAGGPVSI
jgi:hypothetical protein